MKGTHAGHETARITHARPGRTLDVETRTRRYLVTMTIRTVCFLAFLVLPGWWKIAALVAAVVLPLIAVLLANNSDHHGPPAVTGPADGNRRAITSGEVVRGDVTDEHDVTDDADVTDDPKDEK